MKLIQVPMMDQIHKLLQKVQKSLKKFLSNKIIGLIKLQKTKNKKKIFLLKEIPLKKIKI
jgi:hypothetical protein